MKILYGIIRNPVKTQMGELEESVLTAYENKQEAEEVLEGFNPLLYCVKPVNEKLEII